MSKCNYQGYCEACAGDDRYPHAGKIIDSPTNAPVNHDPVNQPQHYASGEIECIDAIRASMTKEAFCGYLKGNMQKYMWRYEKKINPVEDIKKARWYSERLIKELEDA